MKGLIQVYTGRGKGKTTAALGLALRALGQGMQVRMIQFVKNVQGSGEVKMAGQLPGFSLEQFGSGRFVKGRPGPDDREKAAAGWEAARESLQGEYDLVILDEISHVLNKGLLSVEEVLEALSKRSPQVEVVLTGRDMPPEIIDKADLVTEMVPVKHPYDQGLPARRGIEF